MSDTLRQENQKVQALSVVRLVFCAEPSKVCGNGQKTISLYQLRKLKVEWYYSLSGNQILPIMVLGNINRSIRFTTISKVVFILLPIH